VSGPPIENGTVVIRDGLIAAVGANVDIPKSAAVIDGQGLIVYPGLIDALSTIGLEAAAPAATTTTGRGGGTPSPATPQAPSTEAVRPAQGPEDRPSTTPWINAADQISPTDRRVEAARNAGFTTALVAPSRGIFAGYGALVDLAGSRPNEMVVKTPVAFYMALSSGGGGGGAGGFPNSLFGVIAYVRQTFLDLRHYQQDWAAYNAQPRGHKRPEYDRALEGLQAVSVGRVPLLMPAQTSVQIRRYLDFGAELGVPFMLYGVQEAYREAPLLAQRQATVLVSVRWAEPERDTDPERLDTLRALRFRDLAPSTPAALHKAGVRFALYSDNIANPRDALRNVKRSIDAGLPADAALRALTLSPAEIFGVSDRLGSIEPGKVANLVVADGDLFADRTKIKYVFVDGRKFTVPEEEAPARPPGAPAVNISGTWNLTVEMPDRTYETTATLQQQGSTLTGSLISSAAPAPMSIAGGSISGNELSFTLTVPTSSGPVQVIFRGTVTGNSIKGTVTVPGSAAGTFSGTKTPGREQEVE
jgi:hypothetical protein